MRILLSILLAFGLVGMVDAKKTTSKRNAPAKQLFGKMKIPAQMKPQAIGGYAKGCLAGAEKLPENGPGWQAMRLSRNRNWGHPELIDFIERFTEEVKKDGWRGLLVGDLAQPRGGPMLTGHASHQLGLDADIWFKQMPKKKLSKNAREKISAVSMIKSRSEINPKVWKEGHAKNLRRAASDKAVARIFVHPAIKKAMCDWSKGQKDRTAWLRKLRPWYGHHYHFHVRLACPKGDRICKNQPPPPPGPGCGKKLAWWLSGKPYKKIKKPKPGVKPKKPKTKIKKRREMRLADLPRSCTEVLNSTGAKQAKAVVKKQKEPDI